MVDMIPRGLSFSRDKYEVFGNGSLCKNIKSTNIKFLWKMWTTHFWKYWDLPRFLFAWAYELFSPWYFTCFIYKTIVYLRNQWLDMREKDQEGKKLISMLLLLSFWLPIYFSWDVECVEVELLYTQGTSEGRRYKMNKCPFYSSIRMMTQGALLLS